jgi:hypothetical protein
LDFFAHIERATFVAPEAEEGGRNIGTVDGCWNHRIENFCECTCLLLLHTNNAQLLLRPKLRGRGDIQEMWMAAGTIGKDGKDDGAVFGSTAFQLDYLTRPSFLHDIGLGAFDKVDVSKGVQESDRTFVIAYPHFNIGGKAFDLSPANFKEGGEARGGHTLQNMIRLQIQGLKS